MSLLDKVRAIAKSSPHPFKSLKSWASGPRRRERRRERWRALARWAEIKRRNAPPHSAKRRKWARRQEFFEAKEKANEPKPITRKVIGRSVWGAAAPRSKSAMTSTAEGVFVHHTVAGAPTDEAGERAEMRNLQQIAFSRGFDDISYSFVVMPSGRVYEGRGLNVAGAHTIGFNSTAYGCAAAGNYEIAKPTEAMVAAFRWLRREYLDLADRPLRPHSAVSQTACPGQHLRARLSDL